MKKDPELKRGNNCSVEMLIFPDCRLHSAGWFNRETVSDQSRLALIRNHHATMLI